MPIRLSGLSSGLDTESLVSALVSSYTLQKDNLVKAQTKLSWKQESWKTMNKSIYSFYTGKLSSMRFSKNYNLKTATVSNSSYAKVTASSSAVNGISFGSNSFSFNIPVISEIIQLLTAL